MEEEKRLRTKKLHVGITTLGSKQGVMRHYHPWRLYGDDDGASDGSDDGDGDGSCDVGDGDGVGVGRKKGGDGVSDGSGFSVGKGGSGIGEWDGIGWHWRGRRNSGTSLQINCPFFLSGYCHERGAEEGALALAWRRAHWR